MQHHLGTYESVSAGVIYISAKLFLQSPRIMAQIGGTGGWMIFVISSALTVLTLWAMNGILTRYPEHTLIEATEQALGPVLGTAVNLAYFWFFFGRVFIVLRQFAESIVTAILPRTSLPFLCLCFLLLAGYATYLGLEAITRVAWMAAPFMAIGAVTLLVSGGLTYTGRNALFPFWGFGPLTVLDRGLTKVGAFGEVLFFGLLTPNFRKPAQLRRAAGLSLLISALFTEAAIITYFLVFPYPTSTRMSFPLLQVSRVIIAGRWFQRLESVFLVIWISAAAISMAVSLYASTQTLSRIMRHDNHRHLIIPLSVAAFSLSLVPSNLVVVAQYWDAHLLRTWGTLQSPILPLLTWLVILVRGKMRATHAA